MQQPNFLVYSSWRQLTSNNVITSHKSASVFLCSFYQVQHSSYLSRAKMLPVTVGLPALQKPSRCTFVFEMQSAGRKGQRDLRYTCWTLFLQHIYQLSTLQPVYCRLLLYVFFAMFSMSCCDVESVRLLCRITVLLSYVLTIICRFSYGNSFLNNYCIQAQNMIINLVT